MAEDLAGVRAPARARTQARPVRHGPVFWQGFLQDYKIGNVQIIPVQDDNHLTSPEARARRVRNSRATRRARHASEIKDDQHWQFGLRIIPPKV
jgi:hypothetical protein